MNRVLWSVLAVGLVACEGSRAAQPEARVATAGDCLVALDDGALQGAQAKAKAASERESAAAWVAVGHELVRIARTRSEPALYRDADACAERALEAQPGDPNAQHLRGVVLLNDHRFAEAHALAQALIERDADDVFAYSLLSDSALELGAVPVAVDAAQRMLDLKPSLLSYGRAAHLRWLTGDVAGALELYRLAIGAGRVLPDREPSAWMISESARVFLNQGDLAGAEAGFEAALREVPEYAPALQGKGRVALARGEYQRAAQLLERALVKDALVETAWLLGESYEKLGLRQRAQAQYRIVEREGALHDPRMLALFYAERGVETERAVKLARAELKQRPDVYSHDALALALFRAGKLEEARGHMQQALALGTPDARLRKHGELIMGAQASLSSSAKVTP